jgi:hypothetical protein
VFLGHSVGYSNVGSNKLMIDNSDVNSSSALIYGEFDTDKIKLNAKVTVRDIFNLTRESQTSITGNTITVTKSYVYVGSGNGGNVTLGPSGTAINNGVQGDVLILEGSSDVLTVTILDNANTKLNGSMVLGAGDTIMLMFDGSDWVEISRSNN